MSEEDKETPLFDEKNKIVQSIEGIKKFSESLGPSDIYKDILIEELLKIFMKSS
jgi:hypothetical protein